MTICSTHMQPLTCQWSTGRHLDRRESIPPVRRALFLRTAGEPVWPAIRDLLGTDTEGIGCYRR
jgi:hypothetical protein